MTVLVVKAQSEVPVALLVISVAGLFRYRLLCRACSTLLAGTLCMHNTNVMVRTAGNLKARWAPELDLWPE